MAVPQNLRKRFLDLLHNASTDIVIEWMEERSIGANATINDDHQTVLFEAHSGLIGDLVEFGTDPNHQDIHGRTALHGTALHDARYANKDAILGGAAYARAAALLESGADARIRDEDGCTPLHAVMHSVISVRACVRVMMELLYHGANIDAVDNKGDTAAHLVTTPEHVFALALHGADMTILDGEGRTPAEAIEFYGNDDTLAAIRAVERMRTNGSTEGAAKK